MVVSNDPDIEYDGPKDAREMFNSRKPSFQLSAFTKRGVWVKVTPIYSQTHNFLRNLRQ